MATETSISIGKHLRAALLATEVGQRFTGIHPLTSEDNERLPYAAFLVMGGKTTPTTGETDPDRVQVALDIYAETYDAATELAEEVRASLRGLQTDHIASVYLAEHRDGLAGDAYAKTLILDILTN